MKKMTTILGIAAVAGVAYKVLTRKKADGSTLLDDLTEASKGWTDKVSEFADANKGWSEKITQFVEKIKDRLMPDVKGPNGEDVFMDMYKRNYYKNDEGTRVYMDTM
ncbi:MAG: hypothetical protein V4708_09905 [Bacteroidota bacterium]